MKRSRMRSYFRAQTVRGSRRQLTFPKRRGFHSPAEIEIEPDGFDWPTGVLPHPP